MEDKNKGKVVRRLLGDNLRRLRMREGLSQLQLASLVGLAHNFINDIENEKKWVSSATIAKLAGALKVEPYELFIPESHIGENDARLISGYIDDLSDSFLKAVGEIKNRYLDDPGQN